MAQINVLFVCMGNICRSPMAEGLLLDKVAKRRLSNAIVVDSAGCGDWHEGELPDARARRVSETYGLSLVTRARKVIPSDMRKFDYILVMDQINLQHVKAMMARLANPNAQIMLMREFDPEVSDAPDVIDPYAGEMDGFETVFRILDRSTEAFLEFLMATHELKETAETN